MLAARVQQESNLIAIVTNSWPFFARFTTAAAFQCFFLFLIGSLKRVCRL